MKNFLRISLCLLISLCFLSILPNQVKAYTVQGTIFIVPNSDRPNLNEKLPKYKENIIRALKDTQQWYANKLNGKTFFVAENDVRVVYGQKAVDPKYYKNASEFFTAAGGPDLIQPRDGYIETIFIIGSRDLTTRYGSSWLWWHGGQGGLAYLNEVDLERLSYPNEDWDKKITLWLIAHELGHTFGLVYAGSAKSHPCTVISKDECQPNSPEPLPPESEWSSIMGYGGIYPESGFNQSLHNPERSKIDQSRFMNIKSNYKEIKTTAPPPIAPPVPPQPTQQKKEPITINISTTCGPEKKPLSGPTILIRNYSTTENHTIFAQAVTEDGKASLTLTPIENYLYEIIANPFNNITTTGRYNAPAGYLPSNVSFPYSECPGEKTLTPSIQTPPFGTTGSYYRYCNQQEEIVEVDPFGNQKTINKCQENKQKCLSLKTQDAVSDAICTPLGKTSQHYWFCNNNDVVQVNPEGNVEVIENCTQKEQSCVQLNTEEYQLDAQCLSGDKGGEAQEPQSTQTEKHISSEQASRNSEPTKITLSNYPNFQQENNPKDDGTQTLELLNETQSVSWTLSTLISNPTLYIRQVYPTLSFSDYQINPADNEEVNIGNIKVVARKLKRVIKITVSNQELKIENLSETALRLPGTEGTPRNFDIPIIINYSNDEIKAFNLRFNYKPQITSEEKEPEIVDWCSKKECNTAIGKLVCYKKYSDGREEISEATDEICTEPTPPQTIQPSPSGQQPSSSKGSVSICPAPYGQCGGTVGLESWATSHIVEVTPVCNDNGNIIRYDNRDLGNRGECCEDKYYFDSGVDSCIHKYSPNDAVPNCAYVFDRVDDKSLCGL